MCGSRRDRPGSPTSAKRAPATLDEAGELALQCRRGRVHVGVHGVRAERREHRLGRGECRGPVVAGEHQPGARDRRLRVVRPGHTVRHRRDDRIEAAHLDTRSHEVGCDPSADLAETEHANVHERIKQNC